MKLVCTSQPTHNGDTCTNIGGSDELDDAARRFVEFEYLFYFNYFLKVFNMFSSFYDLKLQRPVNFRMILWCSIFQNNNNFFN